PEVHAPELCRRSRRTQGAFSLPLPQRLLRAEYGRSDRRTAAPAARADPPGDSQRRPLRRRDRDAGMKRPPSTPPGTGPGRPGRGFSRPQKMTIVLGILSVVVIIVVLQLWLLTATMNAFLAGRQGVIIPAALASIVCCALNLGLLSYISRMERP